MEIDLEDITGMGDEIEKLRAENERLRALPIMWLGQWRDHIPAKAVTQLQDALAA